MKKINLLKPISICISLLIISKYSIQKLGLSDENYSKIRCDSDLLDENESYIDVEKVLAQEKSYINDFVFQVYKGIDYKKSINDIKNVFENYLLENNKLTLYYQGTERIEIELSKDEVYKVKKVTYTDSYGRIVQSELGKNDSLIFKVSDNGIENLKEVDSFDKQEEFLKNKPPTVLF